MNQTTIMYENHHIAPSNNSRWNNQVTRNPYITIYHFGNQACIEHYSLKRKVFVVILISNVYCDIKTVSLSYLAIITRCFTAIAKP